MFDSQSLCPLLPAVFHAWPEDSPSSRAAILAEWGWEISSEREPSCWNELLALVDTAGRMAEVGDGSTWGLGSWKTNGWQLILSAHDRFGGLREVYTDFGFPVLEWTLRGSDDTFDLDIMIPPNSFFFGHVTGGKLNESFERLTGQIPKLSLARKSEEALLSMNVPTSLEPSLHGLPAQIIVYSSLSTTLAGLGVPSTLWPSPPDAVIPTFLELRPSFESET